MCESNPFITITCEHAYSDFCFNTCKLRARGCATRPYSKEVEMKNYTTNAVDRGDYLCKHGYRIDYCPICRKQKDKEG